MVCLRSINDPSKLTRPLYYSLVYSPDDDGYYAEVWNRDGECPYQTSIQPTPELVRAELDYDFEGDRPIFQKTQ